MTSSRYLLAVSIGPVQDFIRAGRKTRDLWYGSDLLVRAARAAARRLRDAGAEPIFPHADALDADDVAVPNKLLVLLPNGSDPADLATKARDAARDVLIDDWDTLALSDWLQRRLDVDLARAQLRGFLEWYAAWYPYDPATYKTDRQTLDRLLAGRKALRDFAQPPKPKAGRTGVRKSSLDPGRESVLLLDPADAREEASVRSALHLKRGEEVDGVSLVKRLAEPRRFVSTGRLAIEPFVQRAGATALAPLRALADTIQTQARALQIESWAERFKIESDALGDFAAFPFDTQLFWDDGERDVKRLLDEGQDDPRIAANRAGIEALGKTLRSFYEEAHRIGDVVGVAEFPTYLAVLAADGDKMGAALNGLDDYGKHQAFSKRLTDFAAAARATVARYQGALVYSGGDDVLAFLPLHTALCCADGLRRDFERTVNTPEMERVTLSVGVAIGHYSEHLDNLLQWARDAEGAAKEAGRNALAVSLHARSGGQETRPVVHRWTANGTDRDPVTNRWLRWVKWHRRNTIPDSAAFDLRELMLRLRDLGRARLIEPRYDRKELPGFPVTRWSLLDVEAERVLRRKRAGYGVDPLTDAMIGTILAFLHEDLAEVDSLTGRAREERAKAIAANPAHELDGLVRELLIARRLAAASSVAHGDWREGQDACGR